ncbi:MAG TPA: hybrid sensor histidine kinase/response regulator [Stellaceae bacterium]|nr:hybrid sensor histidine kinase/response regulator [Stellaceae bacterium]
MRMRRPRLSRWAAERTPRLIALALLAAGALPPVGLAALPGGLSMLGAPRTGIVLVTALLFAPALVGFAVALQGFDAVLARMRAEPSGEYRQIIGRVLLGFLVLAYVFAILAFVPGDAAVAPCLLIAALGLAAAWQFLLHLILDPRPSAVRRHVAMAADIGVLSALLFAGGGLTAALCPVYPYIAISSGHHYGLRSLTVATLLGAVAFAAVVIATPFWREQPMLAGGMFAALVLLPAYVASLLHGLAGERARAEAANIAKSRFLTALGEDLRNPLRMIARAGAAIDRAAIEPEQWDMIARIRLSARSMLLQLDDILNYVRIEGGDFAPETRSFDLYRLANGAVAALRAQAAERGIVLALRIDPQLPYQLRGWPHQLRQILICLITNALRHSGKAKVRVNLDAALLDTDRITVRIAVTSSVLDTPPEFTGEPVDPVDDAETGRHLGLAMVERLVSLMEGRLSVETGHGRGVMLAVELPFAVDHASLALPLDLAHLPVLIVTKDSQFVGDVVEPLEGWRADARWIGAGEAALAYLDAFDPEGRRPVLIVDGRGDVLQALSWAHRAVSDTAPSPPYILFVADEPRADSVIGLADGDLDGILPAPFTLNALRSALHALRVEPADWFLAGADAPSAIADEPIAPPRRPTIAELEPAPPPAADVAPPVAAPAPPPAHAAAARPKPRSPARRPQVLIAAANAANRKIIGSILTRAGHAVHLVETIDEAREGLDTREIDLLLLDLVGSGKADHEAVRLCRRVRPGLPIVALTGNSAAEAERLMRDTGLDAALAKPLEPSRLIATIEAAIRGELAQDEPEDAVVTAIASHPRFAGEAPIDERAIRALWSLGDGRQSFHDVIDAFRTDSRRILDELSRAALAADTRRFADGIEALRSCTANFGGGRLRDLLLSLRGVTAVELRRQGAAHVQRLDAEIAKLDALLIDYLKSAE